MVVMCGRFTLRTPAAELVDLFRLLQVPELQPRYNIAPTQPVAAVKAIDSAANELTFLQWGLIPSWAKDPKIGSRMINARGETAASKPSFRAAFKRRRCLIAADGFYEWQKMGGRIKQPVYITMKNEEPFAFAGLWEHWEAADGSAIDSCTIITTAANPLLAEIHDRMPVILPEDAYGRWLDPQQENKDALQPLLKPYPSDEMKMSPISTLVNNPRNDVAECVEAIEI